MLIGELAKRAGMATSAVRYYERMGLLARAGRTSGRRIYDGSELPRLALIAFARECGFGIAEISVLLSAEEPRGPRARWVPLARAKLVELDQLEAKVKSMRQLLRKTLECNCLDLEGCGRRIQRIHRRTR